MGQRKAIRTADRMRVCFRVMGKCQYEHMNPECERRSWPYTFPSETALALVDFFTFGISPGWLKTAVLFFASEHTGEVDHVVAVNNGGKHHVKNYAWSCRTCNRKKSDNYGWEPVKLEPWQKVIDLWLAIFSL